MKKRLYVFGLLLVGICFITGCNIGKKSLVYKGNGFNVTFEVINSVAYKMSNSGKDTVTNNEKSAILGDNFKIGIEEDRDISLKIYNGDFNKYMNNFKDEKEFKKVTYNNINGFQKYYGTRGRYEVYLPVNKDVNLKLNIYSNGKDSLSKVFKSKEVQDILNSIVIKVK